MKPPPALGHRPWSTRAATACPVQVWGWPLGCPWSARRRRARGQGACCFRVASSRRCDDECSSALAVRDGRGSSQRHQSQARTVRALRRPASQLSQGIAEPSAAARHIGKAAAKIVQTLLQSLQSDCQICKRRGPGTTSPRRAARHCLHDELLIPAPRRTPEGCQST